MAQSAAALQVLPPELPCPAVVHTTLKELDSRNGTWLKWQQQRIRHFLFRVFLRDVNLKTLDDELFDMCPIFGQVLVAAISGAGEGSKEPELFITQ